MNKKIDIIELFKLIKEEKQPKQIICYNIIYYWNDFVNDYESKETESLFENLSKVFTLGGVLDEEIQILEDEEKVEEIKVDDNNYIVTDNRTNLKGRTIDITFVNKINEIIKKVNELDKKINKED